jgi:hypothetical protein
MVVLGLAAHHRGTALLQRTAGVPLFLGFVQVYVGLSGVSVAGGWPWEALLVADCVGFLLTGLALHRNSLVLLSAVALPFTVGRVTQRHMDAVWAWSATIVWVGASLVFLSLRLSSRRPSAVPAGRRRAPRTRPARAPTRRDADARTAPSRPDRRARRGVPPDRPR